jgi:uncharacterized membrane protein
MAVGVLVMFSVVAMAQAAETRVDRYAVIGLGPDARVEGVDALGTGFGSYKGQAALLLPTGPELLGFLPGGTFSDALGRRVGRGTVGMSDTRKGGLVQPQRAFWRYNGVMQEVLWLPDYVGNYIVATDLNATQIVGYGHIKYVRAHALVWDLSDLTHPQTLPTLGGGNDHALRINPRGVIIGFSDTAANIPHATMWVNRVAHDLTPGTPLPSYARAINPSGVIVGAVGTHAWRWTVSGGSEDVGFLPGDVQGALSDINASGVAVGTSSGPDATLPQSAKALRVTGTIMSDLNAMITAKDWVLHEAIGISDGGIIAGHGTFRGASQDFLLIPVHNHDDRDDRAESR